MNGLLYAIECRMAERPSGHATRGIQKLRALYGEQIVQRAFIACSTESRYDIAPGVTVVNGWRTWDLDS